MMPFDPNILQFKVLSVTPVCVAAGDRIHTVHLNAHTSVPNLKPVTLAQILIQAFSAVRFTS